MSAEKRAENTHHKTVQLRCCPRRKYPHCKAQQELNVCYAHLKLCPALESSAQEGDGPVGVGAAPEQHTERAQQVPKRQHHILPR